MKEMKLMAGISRRDRFLGWYKSDCKTKSCLWVGQTMLIPTLYLQYEIILIVFVLS